MNALAKVEFISPEAYLLHEIDRQDGLKHEYVNGQIYAMVGASRSHNRLAGSLYFSLRQHLQSSKCEVYQSDMKLRVKTLREECFYYPDIQVTCEEEDETYYNESPCLIIEVLSESTARIDRTEKLAAYRTIPALQEYVLCSQDIAAIEIYRRSNDWQMENYTSGQTIALASVDMTLDVDELYGVLR